MDRNPLYRPPASLLDGEDDEIAPWEAGGLPARPYTEIPIPLVWTGLSPLVSLGGSTCLLSLAREETRVSLPAERRQRTCSTNERRQLAPA